MKGYSLQKQPPNIGANEYKGSAVSYLLTYPSPVLRDYIDFYYQAEVIIPENKTGCIDVRAVLLPLNSVEMIFCYNDTSVSFNNKWKNSSTSCSIIGTQVLQSRCYVSDISKINKSFFVRFKPGGFSKLFGIRQNELKNSFFSADDVLNSFGRNLENRINNSASIGERVKEVESYFIQYLRSKDKNRFGNPKEVNTIIAMQLVNKSRGNIKVHDIAKFLNIPERTLNWNFSNYIGLSPKDFISLFRFRNCLSKLRGKEDSDWIALAQFCGYYDQSHLINEFKCVTGITPNLYLKNLGKTFFKCTNKLFFVEPSANDSLNEYTSDLMQAEKIATL